MGTRTLVTAGTAVVTVTLMAVGTVGLTGPAVAAASPPVNRRGNVVGRTTCHAWIVVVWRLHGKGVVSRVWCGGIPRSGLAERVSATAHGWWGGGNEVRHDGGGQGWSW